MLTTNMLHDDAARETIEAVKNTPELEDPEGTLVTGAMEGRNVIACERIRPLTTNDPIEMMMFEGVGGGGMMGGGAARRPVRTTTVAIFHRREGNRWSESRVRSSLALFWDNKRHLPGTHLICLAEAAAVLSTGMYRFFGMQILPLSSLMPAAPSIQNKRAMKFQSLPMWVLD